MKKMIYKDSFRNSGWFFLHPKDQSKYSNLSKHVNGYKSNFTEICYIIVNFGIWRLLLYILYTTTYLNNLTTLFLCWNHEIHTYFVNIIFFHFLQVVYKVLTGNLSWSIHDAFSYPWKCNIRGYTFWYMIPNI